jgi:glycosyltransferase involved in cell wall biosynthesis
MTTILLTLHVGPDTGYAIDSLLTTFIKMARQLVDDDKRIHISFPNLIGLEQCKAISDVENIIEFDAATRNPDQLEKIKTYIREHGIDVVFGFDQPVQQVSCRYMRQAGAKWIISYQGAPMSSLNTGIRLLLKQMEVCLRFGSPDHYIFESQAMAETAYRGRGIPFADTSIVHLGVDEVRYRPTVDSSYYAHDMFDIPRDRKIIYYSGHMEERKGVAVLVDAAKYLYESYGRSDFHFLILGNRDGEEQRFLDMLKNSGAQEHISFGGYRNDIERILPTCYLGAIASTGWDSFTMSSLEIASCGLPLIVSRLQGLVETIEEGKTGYSFTPGSHVELSDRIIELLDDPDKQARLGASGRYRILSHFTKQQQIEHLASTVRLVVNN